MAKKAPPPVYRRIIKKNEKQGKKLFDILICQHAVRANDNTYRTARACPECAEQVEKMRQARREAQC